MSTNLPRITIVTPSFNQANYLPETIESVLSQNYPNLEYMIIDGGSTDGSVDIIKKYESHLSYWVSERDKGQSEAINKGFRKSTGEILAYLNSDDTYCEGALQNVGEFFKSHPKIDLFYGNTTFINEKNEPIGAWKSIKYNFHIHLYGGPIIPQPSAFWRRQVFFDVGEIDENLQFAMDGDLWFRIAKANAKFHFCDVMLSCFRIHNSSKSVELRTKHLLEAQRVREQINGGNFSKYERYIMIPFTKLKKRRLGFKFNMKRQ